MPATATAAPETAINNATRFVATLFTRDSLTEARGSRAALKSA